MRIADAFTLVREGKADACRRRCWHSSMLCIAAWDQNRTIHLFSLTKNEEWPYWPHSIDIRADDWVALRLG